MKRFKRMTPDELISILSALPPEVRARPLKMSVEVDDGAAEVEGFFIWENGDGLACNLFNKQQFIMCPPTPFGTLEIFPDYTP